MYTSSCWLSFKVVFFPCSIICTTKHWLCVMLLKVRFTVPDSRSALLSVFSVKYCAPRALGCVALSEITSLSFAPSGNTHCSVMLCAALAFSDSFSYSIAWLIAADIESSNDCSANVSCTKGVLILLSLLESIHLSDRDYRGSRLQIYD